MLALMLGMLMLAVHVTAAASMPGDGLSEFDCLINDAVPRDTELPAPFPDNWMVGADVGKLQFNPFGPCFELAWMVTRATWSSAVPGVVGCRSP
jgi:hypothetical protein